MKFAKYILLCISVSLPFLLQSCSDSDDDGNSIAKNQLVNNVLVPSTTFYLANSPQITIQGKGFQEGDILKITFLDDPSIDYTLTIVETDNYYITFSPPADLESGEYLLTLYRGQETQQLGVITFRISIDLNVPDKASATIKGAVFCGKEPIVGAAVSDGVIVTTTDDQGYYWLESEKYHGYVFVTTPSGYEPLTNGAFPLNWSTLNQISLNVEQHNFEFMKVDNDNHVMLALADLHLANRTGDISQFERFTVPDVKQTVAGYSVPVYGMVVGDMTWDAYWRSNNFDPSHYVNKMNSYDFPLMLYHCPGNHDNNPYSTGDYDAELMYKEYLGPTYYSFDIGRVHYVMLDNVIYDNTGGSSSTQGSRDYRKQLTEIQYAWLEADLELVDSKTPVIVGLHCPVSYFNSSLQIVNQLETTAERDRLLAMFDKFEYIHFVSGHTHNNVSMKVSDRIFERNTAAVCATWWWTGYITSYDYQVCKDGSPGGYGVYEINGTDIEWYYKGYGEDRNKQFRTYDMNSVKSYFSSNPQAVNFVNGMNRNDYASVGNNVVFINVWAWDTDWKVEVREGQTPLTVNRIYQRDPLHTISYDIPRYTANGSITPDFATSNNYHTFYVTASSAGSTLDITVTDRFGNVYTETMSRPKTFELSMD